MVELDGDDLPPGWTVWSDAEGGQAVLAYRPDVFDADAFPPECLPMVHLTHGRRSRRPGSRREAPGTWIVTLYLEPDVNYPEQQYETREAAVEGALDLAERFADGEVDYRGLYQVPREGYFRKLDELTGRSLE